MPFSTPVPEDGLQMPIRIWAIVALATGTFLAVIVTGTSNIALPTISQEFDISPAESVWLINIYQLLVTILLLPLAAVGSKLGYRNVYLIGLLIFALGSLACGLANTFPELVFARAIQGVGGAGIMSVGAAITRIVYPSRLFGRGISISAMVVAISATSGPVLASVILAVADWRWLYYILLPFSAISFFIGLRVLPSNRLSETKFDFQGAILSALTLGFFILGVSGIGHKQPVSEIAIELTLSVLIGVIFVKQQMNKENPLLPLNLLKIPILSLSLIAAFTSFSAQAILLITLPFYFQFELGFSPAQIGFLVAVWPLTTLFVSPLVGYLADRYSAGLLGSFGLGLAAIGMLILALLTSDVSVIDIAIGLAMIGGGYAFFQQPNARIVLSAPPKDQAGSASALLSTTRLSGQTTGAAMAAIVFTIVSTGAYSQALTFSVFIMLFAILASLLRMKPSIKAGHKEF